MNLSHICGERFEANVFDSHGEIIFDPGECPSCGQVLTDSETKPYERGDNCIMDFRQAQITVASYCCSNCWSHVVSFPFAADKTRVLCPRCGEDTRGYVSRHYADRRRQNSLGEKIEAAYTLRGVIKSPVAGQTEGELLKGLGY